MQIILKEDVKHVGDKNDIVTVKPGYGRNFLLPQGLAVMATESAKKVVAENTKQAAHKAEKVRLDAAMLAQRIGDITLELKAKANADNGRIFGRVTSLQLADALKAKGFDIDRKRVDLPEGIKELGEYTATLNLHKDVKHPVKFRVVGE
jgi:large subunit ribosomal protein L9